MSPEPSRAGLQSSGGVSISPSSLHPVSASQPVQGAGCRALLNVNKEERRPQITTCNFLKITKKKFRGHHDTVIRGENRKFLSAS